LLLVIYMQLICQLFNAIEAAFENIAPSNAMTTVTVHVDDMLVENHSLITN